MDLDLLLAQHKASPELSVALHALFHSSQEELASAHQKVEHLEVAAKRDQFTIERLTFELARLNRIRFARTSETLKGTQLDLFAEELDEEIGELAAALHQAEAPPAETSGKPRTQRVKAGRQPIPDHLPRIVIRHELNDCRCGQCGNPLVQIGEDVTEKLRVIPARFEVERHVRPKYACRPCETIKATPVPASVIEGGMATPSVLSWSSYPNIRIICRSIALPRSLNGRVSLWLGPRWVNGWVKPVSNSRHSMIGSRNGSWRDRSSTPMKVCHEGAQDREVCVVMLHER